MSAPSLATAKASKRRAPRGLSPSAVALCVVATCFAVFWTGFLLAPTTPGDNSPEAGFARDMSVHHAQAVDMAESGRRSSNPLIRSTAIDIELTQQAQIGQLQGWLDQWQLPATGTEAPMTWMGDPMTSRMPGMASPQQMQTLKHAHGRARDILFLQLMIRHHAGALGMAQAALDLSERPEVRSFAQKTIVAQTAEIATMDSMLVDLGAQPVSAESLATVSGTRGMQVDHDAASMAHEESVFTDGLRDFFKSLLHFLPIVFGGFAAMCLLLDFARRQRWIRSARDRISLTAFPIGSMLLIDGLLASAAAHAALAPEHFDESAVYGAFFVASTVVAVALAAGIVLFGSRRLIWIAAALLIALVVLYVLFRFVPPPLAAEPEEFEAVGLLTQLVQVIGLGAACALYRLSSRAAATERVSA